MLTAAPLTTVDLVSQPCLKAGACPSRSQKDTLIIQRVLQRKNESEGSACGLGEDHTGKVSSVDGARAIVPRSVS
jgi:hypothetical protein